MLTNEEVLLELGNIRKNLGCSINLSERFPGESLVSSIKVSGLELVKQIFSHSDKMYIMIKDDAIIYANNAFLDFVKGNDYCNVFNVNFYNFLAKGNKTHLLKNLREMLINDITISIDFNINDNIFSKNLRAIYIEDINSLTYILIEE